MHMICIKYIHIHRYSDITHIISPCFFPVLCDTYYDSVYVLCSFYGVNEAAGGFWEAWWALADQVGVHFKQKWEWVTTPVNIPQNLENTVLLDALSLYKDKKTTPSPQKRVPFGWLCVASWGSLDVVQGCCLHKGCLDIFLGALRGDDLVDGALKTKGVYWWKNMNIHCVSKRVFFFLFFLRPVGPVGPVEEQLNQLAQLIPTGPTGPQGSSMMRREFDAGKGSSCRKGKFYYGKKIPLWGKQLSLLRKGSSILRKKFCYEKKLVWYEKELRWWEENSIMEKEVLWREEESSIMKRNFLVI